MSQMTAFVSNGPTVNLMSKMTAYVLNGPTVNLMSKMNMSDESQTIKLMTK